MTGARFAEEIGVQASSVSHILSGRNNPGTDFLIKILERYRGISSEWLLMGKGEMYKSAQASQGDISNSPKQPDLFNQEIPQTKPVFSEKMPTLPSLDEKNSEIAEIVIFYNDNTFKIYKPR